MRFYNPLTAPAGGTAPWCLRRAAAGDAAALALVGRATFLDTYAGSLPGADIVAHCARSHAEPLYARWLADPAHALWLVEAAGGGPLGYQVVAPPDMAGFATAADDVELKRIYLLGRAHGTGAGAAMLGEAIDWARSRGARRLLVALWERNHRAMAFYRRMGFADAGTRSFTVGAATYLDPVLALRL